MPAKQHTKLVQVGDHVAEVVVELHNEDDEWSPYLSVKDAQKLDVVREALKMGDFKTASQYGQVYQLRPVDV